MTKDVSPMVKYCDAEIESNPSAALWIVRGQVLAEASRFKEAIESYTRALELAPDDEKAWFYRGQAREHLRQYEDAIVDFQQVLRIKPDHAFALESLGGLFKTVGKREEAVACFIARTLICAKYMNPSNISIILEVIAEQLRASSYRERDGYDALYSLGNMLRDLGEVETALTFYDKALELNENFPNAWEERGRALFTLDRLQDAVDSFERALLIREYDPDTWSRWRQALLLLGFSEAQVTEKKEALLKQCHGD